MNGAGSDVVVALASARKVVQLYPETHVEFDRAITALVEAVNLATLQGPLSLHCHLGRLYDGNTVVACELPGVATITAAFELRGVESLTFSAGFDRDDAVGLLDAFATRVAPDVEFADEIAGRGVQHVSVAQIARIQDEAEQQEERERIRAQDRELYYRLLSSLRTVMSQLASGTNPDLAESTELVEGLLSRLMEDRAAVLGLATIRGTGERALFHSLNVMIYASVLGRRLGLPESSMIALGTAALLHDIGKSEFDLSDESIAEAMRTSHPEAGARLLEQLALQDPGPMLVAYEHHMHADGTGFPERASGYVAHPYSRMVAVADRFENLTNPERGTQGLTPDRAMVQLLRETPTAHDTLFARLFASAMGVFPVGCMVRLSDSSVGVVSEPGEDPLAPVVRIVYDARGLEIERPPDLALESSELHIVEVIDPEFLNVEVSEKL